MHHQVIQVKETVLHFQYQHQIYQPILPSHVTCYNDPSPQYCPCIPHQVSLPPPPFISSLSSPQGGGASTVKSQTRKRQRTCSSNTHIPRTIPRGRHKPRYLPINPLPPRCPAHPRPNPRRPDARGRRILRPRTRMRHDEFLRSLHWRAAVPLLFSR